jgi:protoporphyrinogen oxidase
MEKFDFLVLGGGISGLGFAKRMSEKGFSVLIIEKEATVGGLSRTIFHNGFYLDFCAHRFHTNNKKLLDEVLSLPGLKMNKHIKRSRIYMFGKYLKYPFEIQNLLRAMPISKSMLCFFSFVYNFISKKLHKKELKSYKDWFVSFYGFQLYNIMCRPYTSKIWHIDPSLISADWANQRFKGEQMGQLINRVIKKLLTLNFSKYDLDDDSLAPDGGPFFYPLRGIQELPDALAKSCDKNGSKIICSAQVLSINTQAQTVTYRKDSSDLTVEYGNLISTIPLHSFYALQDRKSSKVESALANLKYMDIIFVYVFLKCERISNDHWLYFPDPGIIFNRAVEFSNWSPEMCPAGKTSVCFDITCFESDNIWSLSDTDLAAKTISDAIKIKYFKQNDIESYHVFRTKFAYPFYDLDYKNKLDIIVNFLETKKCCLLGRTGIFQYNNSDNSIEMGFKLADSFIENEPKKSIYCSNINSISY